MTRNENDASAWCSHPGCTVHTFRITAPDCEPVKCRLITESHDGHPDIPSGKDGESA